MALLCGEAPDKLGRRKKKSSCLSRTPAGQFGEKKKGLRFQAEKQKTQKQKSGGGGCLGGFFVCCLVGVVLDRGGVPQRVFKKENGGGLFFPTGKVGGPRPGYAIKKREKNGGKAKPPRKGPEVLLKVVGGLSQGGKKRGAKLYGRGAC